MIADRVEQFLNAQEQGLPAAYLVGGAPSEALGYRYVSAPPYSAVLIGVLNYGELLNFQNEAVFSALAEGIPVYLWAPGLPHKRLPCKSRSLLARLASAERELRNLGVLLLDNTPRRRFISAEEARKMVAENTPLPPGAVLSPLAKDIFEAGKEQIL